MYSIGLDISKSTINVYIPLNDLDLVIDNNLKSIKSLYSKLKKYYKKEIDKLVFVYEPTGSYSSILEKFASNSKINCFIINPKQSSSFSKALGNRNKTDKVDARMLSQAIIIAKPNDIRVPVINKHIEEIKELISFYKLITKQKVQYKNHLESIDVKDGSSLILKKLKRKIKMIEDEEQDILLTIKKVLMEDDKLYEAFINIQTIKGVGEVTAIILLYHFIKYPNANQRQIVSLAGLDPKEISSGTSVKGKSRISKSGSYLCRSVLFIVSLGSIQHNEEFKAFYERLKSNGKHSTVAQVALMRKILIIAHSIYKNNDVYEPNRYLDYL